MLRCSTFSGWRRGTARESRFRTDGHGALRLRAGVIADWNAVFASAAQRGVAIEIDGDPARQDLDHTLASSAMAAGCVFALDSDAHTTTQLSYAETALAHARLAGVPPDRIVNCWTLDRLLAWLSNPSAEIRRPSTTAVFET